MHAQDLDTSDDDGAQDKRVYLSLQADTTGKTKFFLSSPTSLTAMAEIRKFLAEQWSCSTRGIDAPDITRLARLSQEQRARIEAAWKEAATRSISGDCSGPLRKDGLSMHGYFDLQPILDLVRQDGIEDLQVTVSLPNTATRKIVAPAGVKASTLVRVSSYVLPVSAPARPIQITFGYSRPDLIRLAVYTSLYVIIPVLIVLIMRRAALRRGGDDAAGAWFSFMKTTQFCVNGTFLLWGATQLNTRDQLSGLLAFAGWSSGWRSIAGQVMVVTVPTWSVYLLCTALSFKVFVRIRNVSWTWTQFMVRQLAQMGKVFFPLTLYLAGFLTMIRNFRAGVAFFGLAWLSSLVLGQLHQKLQRSHPAAITSGPLRDRIFAMAQNLGVKLQQVFVVPAAQSGVANAFATTKRTVLFTDYLIEKLSQREVDAVAAHELTHLRHSHAQKLAFMILGVMLLPGWVLGFLGGVVNAFLLFAPLSAKLRAMTNAVFFSDWTQALFMACFLWIYYLIQKRFEYTADAGAVAATRDPEAMITALVKISRLNLTPLQWGRGSEAMMTHPSTMRRLERIARSCGMPEAHVHYLIQESGKAQEQAATEGYAINARTPGVVTTAKTSGRAQRGLLILVALHILPPAAVAFSLHRFFPVAGSRWWVLLAGTLACTGFYHLCTMWLTRSQNAHRAETVMKAMAGKTAPFRPEQGVPVGFAPTPCPRFFVSGYNWDHGLLFVSSEKLVFIGSHCTLGLRRDQTRTIVLGKGAPSWSNWQRVYCSWEDKESGSSGAFNLLPLQQKSLFRVDSRNLYLRLRAWRNRQGDTGESIPAAEFGPPNLGAVTSMSPKDVNKFSRTFGITGTMLALAAGLSVLLKLDSAWYLVSTVLLIRAFESIPYWRYRERPAVFDATNAPTLGRPPAKTVAVAPPPPPPRVEPDPVTVSQPQPVV